MLSKLFEKSCRVFETFFLRRYESKMSPFFPLYKIILNEHHESGNVTFFLRVVKDWLDVILALYVILALFCLLKRKLLSKLLKKRVAACLKLFYVGNESKM